MSSGLFVLNLQSVSNRIEIGGFHVSTQPRVDVGLRLARVRR